MIFTEEQRKQFETAARPMLEFLNNNCHPHVTVEIDCTTAAIYEGVCAFITEDYLKD